MNAAAKAYDTTGRTLATGRVAEALAFSKAARALEDARQHGEDAEKLRDALRLNRLVWTAVQADITDTKSSLPRRLKAGLMSLSLFVDRVLQQAPVNFDPSQLQVLIDINREMASGLMTSKS